MKLSPAQSGVLEAASSRRYLSYMDVLRAGGNGQTLAWLVKNLLLTRQTYPDGSNDWTITEAGRAARLAPDLQMSEVHAARAAGHSSQSKSMADRCHLDDCPHGAECVHARPIIDPASVKEGRDVRRRPAGRGCRVERLSEDRRKVLVRDNGRVFWVRMDTLVREWY